MHGTSTCVCRHASVDIVQRSIKLSVIGWMVGWVDRTIKITITIKTTMILVMMQINKQFDLATKDVIQLTL